MQKNLQWKLLAIVAITALATWAVLPPEERIRLGLDLEGGVHMVLRVQTDDALQIETETSAEQLSEQLSLQGMSDAAIIPVDAVTIRAEGINSDRDTEFRRLSDERLAASYDRESGAGGTYTFRMRGPVVSSLREEAVRQALQTIEPVSYTHLTLPTILLV